MFSQTYTDYEVIVVNDGSTDNTRDVITKYFDRVSYIEQSNSGPASARNAGINNAEGEYLAFLDSDDLWHPDKLSIQLKYLESNPDAAFVYCRMEEFTNTNDNNIRCLDSVKPVAIKSGRVFDEILQYPLIPLPSVLIKTEIVHSIGGFDESLFTAEDTNLWLKIAWQYNIVGINDILVRRRKHSNNISDNMSIHIGTLDNLDKIVSLIPEVSPALYPPMKNAYSRRGTNMLVDLFYAGNYSNALSICNRLICMWIVNKKILGYWIILQLPASVINFVRRKAK